MTKERLIEIINFCGLRGKTLKEICNPLLIDKLADLILAEMKNDMELQKRLNSGKAYDIREEK